MHRCDWQTHETQQLFTPVARKNWKEGLFFPFIAQFLVDILSVRSNLTVGLGMTKCSWNLAWRLTFACGQIPFILWMKYNSVPYYDGTNIYITCAHIYSLKYPIKQQILGWREVTRACIKNLSGHWSNMQTSFRQWAEVRLQYCTLEMSARNLKYWPDKPYWNFSWDFYPHQMNFSNQC